MIERNIIGLFLIGVASALAVTMLIRALKACEEEMYEEGNWAEEFSAGGERKRRRRKEEAC